MAHIVRLTHDGLGQKQLGKKFLVKRVSNLYKGQLLIWSDCAWRTRQGHYAYRCKPVFRVPARSRPTPTPKYEDLS